MSALPSTDTIDLRAIFRKIQSRWWWFLITIPLSVALAYAYVKTTPKTYDVGSVMLLGNKKRTGFSENSEFIKGTSYLSNTVDLEDNLAVLTSNKIMASTLQRLDFGITYYATKYFLKKEMYAYPPFFVKLDSMAIQVVDLPIEV